MSSSIAVLCLQSVADEKLPKAARAVASWCALIVCTEVFGCHAAIVGVGGRNAGKSRSLTVW